MLISFITGIDLLKERERQGNQHPAHSTYVGSTRDQKAANLKESEYGRSKGVLNDLDLDARLRRCVVSTTARTTHKKTKTRGSRDTNSGVIPLSFFLFMSAPAPTSSFTTSSWPALTKYRTFNQKT